ncbi:MAG: HAD hydrolase family protein [Dehalococcoidia bacterium]
MKNLKQDRNVLYDLIRHTRMVVFDFDGVFTDNRVLVFQDGTEAVICSRSEGLGLAALRQFGLALLVISSETNPVVGSRCQKLDLPCVQSCENKLQCLVQEAAKLNIPLRQVAYMGNDINDIECFKAVGLPVCVADSHSDVLKIARHVTVLPGGRGAVREFCEFILKVKGGQLY